MRRVNYLLPLLLFTVSVFAGNVNIDSLLSIVKSSKNDTNTVKALNQLSKYAGWSVGNLDTAFYYAHKAKGIAEKLNFKQGIAQAYDNIGVAHEHQGKFTKALENYATALKLFQTINYKYGIASIYNNIGAVYTNQGNYPKALEEYFKSLKIRKDIGDTKGVATVYINMGLIYSNQGNYDNALEKYFAALKIYKNIGDKRIIGLLYNNIGIVYYYKENDDEALKNYLLALQIRKEAEDKFGIATTLGNIGVIFQDKGQYEKALKYHFESLKMNQEIGNNNGVAHCYNNLANVEKVLNHWNIALGWLKKSLIFSKRLNTKKTIRDTYHSLAEVEFKLGNYKSAYNNYKNYILYRDSLKNKENTKKITQLQMQFKFDQKQSADSIAHAKEKEIQQAKIAKQNAVIKAKQQQQYALFGGLALLLIFAGIMYNRFKKTQKQKRIIETQKAETEHQKQLLEIKNKEISDSINYAKRIQESTLPSRFSLSENLKNSFVLFKPKDIVSGDFYWLEKVGDSTFFAAADCTGHGVPGAMVSVVCANALSKALLEENITETGKILDRAREIVIQQFSHSDENVKDGMDISLCKLTLPPSGGAGGELQWSGANNPLWIITKNNDGHTELVEVKADKQPIGMTDNPQPFVSHNVELKSGDSIYIFSDGYADQFGGKDGKKFKYKPMKELLVSLQNKNIEEQKTALDKAFEDWKGENEQVDDVCIIGLKI